MNLATIRSTKPKTATPSPEPDANAPEVSITIKPSTEHRAVILEASLPVKTWIIRCIEIKSSLFPSGIYSQNIDFSSASNKLTVVLIERLPETIKRFDLNIKVSLSVKSSQVTDFSVVSVEKSVSPLAFFMPDSDPFTDEYVEVNLSNEIALDKNGFLINLFGLSTNSLKFRSCFDDMGLEIKREGPKKLTIHCSSLEIVASIIEEISKTFQLSEISSVCHNFEFDDFKSSFLTIDELKSTVDRLSVEYNEISNMSKASIIHLADGIERMDVQAMKNSLAALRNYTRDLKQAGEMKKLNSQGMENAEKMIDRFIKTGCRLRTGPLSSRLYAQCQNALKNANSEETLADSLINLIRFGIST